MMSCSSRPYFLSLFIQLHLTRVLRRSRPKGRGFRCGRRYTLRVISYICQAFPHVFRRFIGDSLLIHQGFTLPCFTDVCSETYRVPARPLIKGVIRHRTERSAQGWRTARRSIGNGAQRPTETIKGRSSCIKGIIERRDAMAINIGGKESRKIRRQLAGYLRQAASNR